MLQGHLKWVQSPWCAESWTVPVCGPVWSWKEEKASWSKLWRQCPAVAHRAETAAG